MSDGRPLLLGEAPSAAGDRYHAFPLSGSPARRICRIMGWGYDPHRAAYWTLTEHFYVVNAIERHADAYPWRKEVARERFRHLLYDEGPFPAVVCLGRKAASALYAEDLAWGEWATYDAAASLSLDVGISLPGYRALIPVAVAPHPSGRNRVLNEQAGVDVFRATLQGALDRAAEVAGV